MTKLSYAAITPARNEVENLRRLADCLLEQTIRPSAWIVVDNGSTDTSPDLVADLSREHGWILAIAVPGEKTAVPGAPVVRAFHAGLAELDDLPDVVVKLDADVSMERSYFERLLGAFADDPALGIASGACYELEDGAWRERHVTGDHVRGASRAYRRECLEAVLPLEERMGWDGIDELKAAVRGWRTSIVRDLLFYHHRAVGERDGASHRRWVAQGRGARYMGYRFSYLCLRTLHHSRRNPAAFAMLWGYAAAALRREPVCADAEARAYLRRQQSVRRLRARMREASGRS
ncbi:MAG: glycosyltransferase [Thermoleophilaceae bacterium]